MNQTPQVEYPYELPIKVIGHAVPELEAQITQVALLHFAAFDATSIRSRQSSTGKYRSITFQFRAESREHLERLYQSLTACPLVVWSM